ncbi:hypothetical protein MMC10_007062 [Thelotrema lepadinum]|nr:hypothetical protein [Thelotrema lepadinum]
MATQDIINNIGTTVRETADQDIEETSPTRGTANPRATISTTAQDTSHQSANFLNLPTELKLMIGHYVLQHRGVFHVIRKESTGSYSVPLQVIRKHKDRKRSIDIALLRVCKNFNEIFKSQFLASNTFDFQDSSTWTEFHTGFRGASYKSLRCEIRHESYENTLVHMLTKQASVPDAFGSLRNICVVFKFTNQSFEALLSPSQSVRTKRLIETAGEVVGTLFDRIRVLRRIKAEIDVAEVIKAVVDEVEPLPGWVLQGRALHIWGREALRDIARVMERCVSDRFLEEHDRIEFLKRNFKLVSLIRHSVINSDDDDRNIRPQNLDRFGSGPGLEEASGIYSSTVFKLPESTCDICVKLRSSTRTLSRGSSLELWAFAS